ncbi:cupin domain-containing protein [Pantoea cypripedii]|uniref:Uncharacterized protein n=1 Tax=Pantoea cypripedii TaxID=55209 RepID=A0A1X1EXY0_PANCY|nr:cupin domain-containing protein [Pantoea cypripedii]MBP2195017.1 uncharacterized protein YjlB [Pantoea cypripedii]ORM94858.1 hypothetical protein HA50_16520 [Pantoea cypripedii]
MAQFTRRNFLQHSALLAFLLPSLAAKATAVATLQLVNQWRMATDGWVPNNPALPILHFRTQAGQADLMSALRQAGWTPQWQAAPFSYQHFHSRSHAIFVVANGRGEWQLGGDNGVVMQAKAGDVIFLPAGSGQRLLRSQDDFSVIACYPNGNAWDVCRSAINPQTLQQATQLNHRTRRFFQQSGAVI